MNQLIKNFFCIALGIIGIFNSATAQHFKGVATYLSDRDMGQFSIGGDNMSPAMAEQIQAQLKKKFQKEYELRFSLTESTWKEVESLDAGPATASAGGVQLSISTGDGITYKNSATEDLIEYKESFSQRFLISGKLEKHKWVLTGNSKKIGEYNCSEAVYQKIKEKKTISFSNDQEERKAFMDTTNVKAWFTTDIPVPHGPDDFWGLPGLILEVTNGGLTFLCTKIVLNPQKPVVIEIPKKGKKVTREEYAKLSEEMAENMMKKYSGGDGSSTVIQFKN